MDKIQQQRNFDEVEFISGYVMQLIKLTEQNIKLGKGIMKNQKWIGFKKPKFIGIDFDCKGNPLIDWQEQLKLKIDRDTIGYDFKVVAYKKVQTCMED